MWVVPYGYQEQSRSGGDPFRDELPERDFGVAAEAFVFAIADGQTNPLRPASEVQRVVSISGHGEAILSLDFLTDRREMREEILHFCRNDLWHRLAFTAHD